VRSGAAILAVDGGASKVDAALLRRDGSVIGAARVRANGYEVTGDSAFLDDIGRAVNAACLVAEIEPDRRPVANTGVFCLAGADLPVDDRRIIRGLRSRGWSGDDVLRNDTLAVLRAGTDRAWGVGLVCGSGMNCTGVSADGTIFRFPALGTISGDWGGGRDLGDGALWHAVRGEEGRDVATSLRSLVPEHFGLRRARQVTEAIHTGKIDEDRLRELAPVVFTAAAGGDQVARTLIDRQADEVVRMAGTAIRRLRMTTTDPDVVLGGGVFRTTDRPFFDRIRHGLESICALATIRVLTAPPVVGAAMLGLDLVGASRAAHRRAHDALTHERLAGHTRPRH
jgi:N-acetylglucosamine kinase-like BadF-type ATPase